MQAQKRQFTPYERNQLYKYGLNPDQFSVEIQDPVEYLTGHVMFCGLDFCVSRAVLIPRIETEQLIQMVINELSHKYSNSLVTIADVGTGSGAIGITLAHTLEKRQQPYQLVMGDISTQALAVTRTNAQRLIPEAVAAGRVSFVISDVLTNFPSLSYDLMLANLPYIPSARIPYLDTSVKDYEPTIALDGGKEGLDLIATLLAQSESKLSKTGEIWLEIDHTHSLKELQSLSPSFKVQILTDEGGYSRYARLSKRA